MPDADLSRQEWLDERAAVLEFDAKFPRHEAERLALVMWEEKVQRENASAGHGDGLGAISSGGEAGRRGGERLVDGDLDRDSGAFCPRRGGVPLAVSGLAILAMTTTAAHKSGSTASEVK